MRGNWQAISIPVFCRVPWAVNSTAKGVIYIESVVCDISMYPWLRNIWKNSWSWMILFIHAILVRLCFL